MTGWFFFSVSDAFTKLLSAQFSIEQLIGMGALVGAMISGGMILAQHGPRGFCTPNWKLFALRGVLVIVTTYLAVKALVLVTLPDFYGIVFMTPFFVTIMSVLFLNERIGIHRIITLIVGFIGVVVLAGPRLDSIPMGLLLAFLSMIGGSIVTIVIRKIGREPVTLLFAFVPCAANAVFYIPMMCITGFHVPANPWLLAAPALLGIIAFIAFYCFSYAFTRATETAVVAPFHYSQMLWGVLFGYLLFGDVPPVTTVIGSLIILAAGLYMLWREYLHHKVNHSVSTTLGATGTTALPEA